MEPRSKWYLNQKKQVILIIMKNNAEVITFKKQQIYKNNKSFKKAMKEMHDKKLVLINQLRTGNEYKLTEKGEHLGMIFDELTK